MSAASATPSLATLAAPFGPAFTARTTSAASTVLAGIVGADPATARVSTELVATTEVAASPRSALRSI